MRVTIRRRRWRLRFAPLRKTHGECDAPGSRDKEIRISTKLSGERLMDTIIHELLHAGGWDLDEEWVAEMGRDIARTLYKMGYRKEDKT